MEKFYSPNSMRKDLCEIKVTYKLKDTRFATAKIIDESHPYDMNRIAKQINILIRIKVSNISRFRYLLAISHQVFRSL